MNKLEHLQCQNECLKEALNYAVRIIESYEMDIRNSEWTGINLKDKGFCQGTIYTEAIADIKHKAGESPET